MLTGTLLLIAMYCVVPVHAEDQTIGQLAPLPFGESGLDLGATGEWWDYVNDQDAAPTYVKYAGIDVPRDEVVAFALYTHDAETLKMTAQLYPLYPGESAVARLELKQGDQWIEAARESIIYPGWTAHFRLEDWDASKDVPYRVRHGEEASFEGLIRRDPTDEEEIVVAVMSCNGSHDVRLYPNANTVENLKKLNPDFLFFCGDQHYRHTEHTAGWLNFGRDFKDVLRDRPVVTIPDDHDVGHGNLWGEGGGIAQTSGASDGGYKLPPEYVNMVQRQQTWHLPDAWDPTPIGQDITVYYTRLRIGGIDFAILEDRKFKTGPMDTIPKMGPRPDHVNDPNYDPATIDLPGLEMLGDRQMSFLDEWSEDWTGAEFKVALSQTAFCGAVHIHGSPDHYLLADLDSNGWPQSGRNEALRALRRVQATHLCGDQHLAVVVKHGIENDADGPLAFTGPALMNTIYRRWWKPLDGLPGDDPVEDSPLPFTGNFKDGFGNRFRMLAYANPSFARGMPEEERAEGVAIARFNKSDRTVTFECWSRFADVNDGPTAQYPGWPMTFPLESNDARDPNGCWLPEQTFDIVNPVVQVIRESDGEILYTRRIEGNQFRAPVFAPGSYTLKIGKNHPETTVLTHAAPE
jgi:hypothetical protein